MTSTIDRSNNIASLHIDTNTTNTNTYTNNNENGNSQNGSRITTLSSPSSTILKTFQHTIITLNSYITQSSSADSTSSTKLIAPAALKLTSPATFRARTENPKDFNGWCELLAELLNDSTLYYDIKDYFLDYKNGQMDDTLCQALYELVNLQSLNKNQRSQPLTVVSATVLQILPLLIYTLISRQSQSPPVSAPGVAAVLLAVTKPEINEISEEKTLQVCEIALRRYVDNISYMSLSSHKIFCVLARLLVDRSNSDLNTTSTSTNPMSRSLSQLQGFSSWSHTYILSNELLSELVHALTYCTSNSFTKNAALTALSYIHCRAIEDLIPNVLLQTTVLLEKQSL
jgi:hypothetical protein